MKRRRWALGLCVLVGCAGDEGAPARRSGPLYEVPGCPREDEQPVRQTSGEYACRPVGARGGTEAEWTERSDDPRPVIFVRPGAPAGGDGTRGAPLASLAAALAATPPAGTILVARGSLGPAETATLDHPLTLRGAGVAATVLAGAGDRAVLAATAAVTVEGLTVRYAQAPGGDPATGAVVARGAGARLSLRDVSVEGAATGVRAEGGATLCADRVTVVGATRRGVHLLDGARALLRGASVRGGEFGVVSDRAQLAMEQVLIAGGRRDGLAVRGATLGVECSRDDDCLPEPGCAGHVHARVCAPGPGPRPARRCVGVTSLVDVASLGNGVTAARFERAAPTGAEVAAGMRDAVLARPGPVARVTRAVLGGTTLPAGAVGGDGLYVGPGATVELDQDITNDARRGRGSELVGNARTGMLVDGDRTDGEVPVGLRAVGRLRVAGARVASNEGPGLFVQSGAQVEQLAFSEVTDNAALGLGLTSGARIAAIQCNRFVFTRTGTVVPEDRAVAPFTVGDGVSLADGTAVTTVQDTEVSHNARFGFVLSGADLRLAGSTRGVGNGFREVGVQGSATVEGDRGSIGGNAGAPASFRVVRGTVNGGS